MLPWYNLARTFLLKNRMLLLPGFWGNFYAQNTCQYQDIFPHSMIRWTG